MTLLAGLVPLVLGGGCVRALFLECTDDRDCYLDEICEQGTCEIDEATAVGGVDQPCMEEFDCHGDARCITFTAFGAPPLCLASCDAGTCDDRHTCIVVDDQSEVCLPVHDVGEPCFEGRDCATDLACVPVGAESRCRPACDQADPDCPPNNTCVMGVLEAGCAPD